MKKANLARAVLIIGLAWSLTGCAAYMYDGKRYETKESLYQAQASAHSEIMMSISPLPAPVSKKKLVFAIPGEAVVYEENLRRNRNLNPGAMNSASEDMLRTLTNVNYQSNTILLDAIRKKNIYPQVDFVALDSLNGSIAPSETSDVMFYVEPSIGAGQWFYATAKGGRQVFAFDRSPPTQTGRVQNFLAAVQTQAIRE